MATIHDFVSFAEKRRFETAQAKRVLENLNEGIIIKNTAADMRLFFANEDELKAAVKEVDNNKEK